MRIGRAATIAGVVVSCVLILRGGCAAADMEIKKGFIPAKLEIGSFYAEGSCGDIFSYQGAYIFDLKRETIEALNKNGQHFFDDIKTPINAARRAYFYGEWKPTPFLNGLGNLYCAMEDNGHWPSGIPEALRQPGGYYQTEGGRTLIVLPQQGYVIAIASDR